LGLGGRARAVNMSTKDGLPTERHLAPGNASSRLEGAFPVSYKQSDTRYSQMIKSKCATTVSENSTSARPLRNTGKKILVDYDVDSDYSQFVGIKKMNETAPKKTRTK